MKQPVFIRIENTFEEAMYSRTSPVMNFYSFKGVHLLPNQLYPYIQRTYAAEGIELENPVEVLVYDLCGNLLDDLTNWFEILNVFQDPDTGLQQIYWQITDDCPLDFGQQLVYFRVRQGFNSFFYSSPFMLTADGSEYVSRWDYKNTLNEQMLSTGLNIYFRQLDDFEERTSYDTVNTGRRVGMTGKLISYEVWETGIIDINIFRLIKQMRRNAYVYCDLQKTTPYESFDTPRLVGGENFGQAELLLCRDESNTYDPLYVPPTPPVPVPPVPTITLESVTSLNSTQVEYEFSYENFTPLVLTLQYSLDEINWTDNTGSATSPRTNIVPNHLTQNYYYRVAHLPSGTVSNVLQLPQYSLAITLMSAPGVSAYDPNGTKYRIFTEYNFVPTQQFDYECSYDNGATWVSMLYGTGLPPSTGADIENVSSPANAIEPTKFRARHNAPPITVTSAPFDFTIT